MDVNLSQNSISQGMQQAPNFEALLLQLGAGQQAIGQAEGSLMQGAEALHPSFASFLSAPVVQPQQNETIALERISINPSFHTILNEVEMVDSPIKIQLPIQDAPQIIQEAVGVEVPVVAIQKSDIEAPKKLDTDTVKEAVVQYKPVVLKVQQLDTPEEIKLSEGVIDSPLEIIPNNKLKASVEIVDNVVEDATKTSIEVADKIAKDTKEIQIQVADTNQIKMPLEALPVNYVMSKISSNVAVVDNEGENDFRIEADTDDFEQVILKSLNTISDKPKQHEFYNSDDIAAVETEVVVVEDVALPVKEADFIDDIDVPKVIKLAEVSDVKLPVEVQFLTKKFENIKFDKPETELLRSVANQVAVKVSELRHGDNKSMTVQLEPKQLGKIDIHMDIKASGETKLVILTEKFMTFDLLQKTTQQLESILNDNGLKTSGNDISFGLRNENNNQHHQQNKEAPVVEFTRNEITTEVVGRTHYLTMNDGSVNIII